MSLEIKSLKVSDAPQLFQLLNKSDQVYHQHFHPFDFDLNTLTAILQNLKKDQFFGVFINDKLIGFYMLRGWDEGYETPSYGVWISQSFSGKGLARLTLNHAFSYCKILGISQLMLKVHSSNRRAKELYEGMGFRKTGEDKSNNNLIYHKHFDS